MSAAGIPAAAAPPASAGAARRAWRSASAALARIPRAGRMCFLIAFVNCAIWGIVVPPFQVPDEITHFAYAQYMAETGKPPPQGPGAQFSTQEQATLEHLHFFSVIGHAEQRGILTQLEDRELRSGIAGKSAKGEGGTSSVTSQPPLYYTLEAVAYRLTPSSNILTRLAVMRLLSALIAAGTVLAVYMFLRELMPGTPWAWTVGALSIAFQPTFAFVAAGVQGDNMLFLTSAVTFWLMLRAYRRGLTPASGALLGAAVAAGTLSKLTYIGLLPGIAVGVLLLAWRAVRADRRRGLLALAATAAAAAGPVLLYALLNVTVWGRSSPTAGGLAGATNSHVAGGGVVTLHQTIDYIWELYLPRLWFMHHSYWTEWPVWQLWFDGSIGHFGWLDYQFPAWVYEWARWLLYVLLAFALAGLVRLRRRIPEMVPLFACFGLMALGLMGAIGYAGIRYRMNTGYVFEQARYLFPLLPLWALFLTLAARGAGRRWGPAFGAALVLIAMAHGLFAETITIARYYG